MFSKILLVAVLSLCSVNGNETEQATNTEEGNTGDAVEGVQLTNEKDAQEMKNFIKTVAKEFNQRNTSLEKFEEAVLAAVEQDKTKLQSLFAKLGRDKFAKEIESALIEYEPINNILRTKLEEVDSKKSPRFAPLSHYGTFIKIFFVEPIIKRIIKDIKDIAG